jgi:hypothetical protein
MIKSKNFTVEGLFCNKARRRIISAEVGQRSNQPYKSHLNNARKLFEEAIFTHDGNRRQVVLVGQDIRTELNILREIGLDLVGEYNPGLLAILDTQSIAAGLDISPDGSYENCTLRYILEQLEIPFPSRASHSAGNNAHCTLRALFGLGVLSAKNGDDTHYQRRMKAFARISLGSPEHHSYQILDPDNYVRKERQEAERQIKKRICEDRLAMEEVVF